MVWFGCINNLKLKNMKTREINKNIYKLIDTVCIYCWSIDIAIYDDVKKYRDLNWKFYYKHNLIFLKKHIQIWIIKDLYSTDINFKTLKPQIKKILWEHFWFLWRVRNLFR
jgi:hypothetical protein